MKRTVKKREEKVAADDGEEEGGEIGGEREEHWDLRPRSGLKRKYG